MEGVQLVKVRPSFNHNSNCLYIQLYVYMDKYVVLVLSHPYLTFTCGHLKIRERERERVCVCVCVSGACVLNCMSQGFVNKTEKAVRLMRFFPPFT